MVSRPVRVLLVARREDALAEVQGLLGIDGRKYAVDWVATYDAGLQAISEGDHDIYLIDHNLGERDGIALIQEARSRGHPAPMILTVGAIDQELSADVREPEAGEHMSTGRIDASLLRGSIRYLTERSQGVEDGKGDERQLRQSQKMEYIGQLAGGIAHDFNNLLTAIMGYTQLGASIAAPEGPLWHHFQEIFKASERAADLTGQLLAFSRRQDTERQETNLNHLILGTHKMLRRLIGENIELVTVAAPDLGLCRVSAQLDTIEA